VTIEELKKIITEKKRVAIEKEKELMYQWKYKKDNSTYFLGRIRTYNEILEMLD
jgi:hypothetical protein